MRKVFFQFTKIIFIIITFLQVISAQISRVEVAQKNTPEGISVFWYVILLIFGVALFAVSFELLKRRKKKKRIINELRRSGSSESDSLNSINADKEIEWFQKKAGGSNRKYAKKKKSGKYFRKLSKPGFQSNKKDPVTEPLALPVFDIKQIEQSRPLAPLPVSNEEILLSAIEQTNEEFEEDEEMRALALRILATFKTRNSIDAVSQVALYDLSSNLRAQALSVLSEFDHESVFETMVMACADPTREVRAAAARGIFNLSFERKEAWMRIVDSHDHGRIWQCARALVAGELVKPSLERLTHPDKKYAAEALALSLLLIKAGEISEIFQILQNSSDPNLKKAIFHVIRLSDNTDALEELISICKQNELSDDTIKNLEKIRYTRQMVSDQSFAPKPPIGPPGVSAS
jgi:HEAT repeat protein